MPEIICKAVAFASADYKETVALRYDILRKPLGLDFSGEQLAAEENDFHLAAYMDDKLIACLVLTKVNDKEIKMRQVAVAENIQGRGIGKKLVKFTEDFALENGFTLMTLHARETAVPFYLSMNYKTEGQPFTEVGLPHKKMYKVITD
ncbi:MAG: GNAT family N-acetyltransferase [Bacteroidia bacterium]